MAKTCQFAREQKRERLRDKYAEKRAELKKIMNDPDADPDVKFDAMRQLQEIPRNASPTRLNNRCSLTGRSRGYLRKFGISRIEFRRLALLGLIPGVSKSSW